MIRVLFAASDRAWEEYEAPLTDALHEAGLRAALSRHHAPDSVDWIVHAPAGPVMDFTRFSGVKGILSLWAGVEALLDNPTLTQPLARMVDPGLTEGMVEYVTAHVLRHHLGIDRHIAAERWDHVIPPLARERRVGLLGLGALGAASARMLAALNFDVAGWSASAKEIAGVACHQGPGGLETVLRRSEILVLLLPLTPETRGLIDARRLGHMPSGAVIINPGRGGLVVESDLLAALETGQLSHATLDTFTEEPLPDGHPFWGHPAVTVTPHIASATRPATAARAIAANIRRGESGEPLLGLVDRARGY